MGRRPTTCLTHELSGVKPAHLAQGQRGAWKDEKCWSATMGEIVGNFPFRLAGILCNAYVIN